MPDGKLQCFTGNSCEFEKTTSSYCEYDILDVYTRIHARYLSLEYDGRKDIAMRSKVFRSGNSNAVRLPAEIAYPVNTEVEITRLGDTVTIRPAAGGLREAVEILRKMPQPDTIELLERTEVPEREWDR